MSTHQQKLPPLKVNTGWVDVDVLDEPTVVVTFRGYAPVVRVKVRQTGLEYVLYLSAKSMAEGLEPLRLQNGGRFAGLSFQIRKDNEEQYAPYTIQPLLQ